MTKIINQNTILPSMDQRSITMTGKYTNFIIDVSRCKRDGHGVKETHWRGEEGRTWIHGATTPSMV